MTGKPTEHKVSTNVKRSTLDNLEEFIRFDKGINVAEDQIADGVRESLRNRWEFGKLMLAKRKGKQLPNGMLDELVEATGKSRAELKFRAQFAERYPTEDEVARAIATFTSWTQVKRNLPKPPPPSPSKPKQPSVPTPDKPVARDPEVDHRRLDQDIVDWNSLPGTAKEKVERAGRQIRREFQKKLEEAEEKLKAEYEEKLEAGLAHRRKLMDESHAQSRRVLDARKGIMTKADYALIRRCLHPDSRMNTKPEIFNRAFDVFNRLELLFLDEKNFPTKSTLPSWEELKKQRRGRAQQ